MAECIVASESAVLYQIDAPIESKTIRLIQAHEQAIRTALGDWLIELTPSYRTILVQFDALKVDHADVILAIEKAVMPINSATPLKAQSQIIRLPVYYDDQTGPDLERIAQANDIENAQIVETHCMQLYDVYAIGFAPGFAYLGEVDERIAMPRLPSPRKKVPKGAVGIADQQTAIYPAESPGGWNIIGRCPINLFDPNASPVMPFQIGDRVQFMPISKEEYLYLGGEL